MDIFEKDKVIAPQNFDLAIALGVVASILPNVEHFCPEQYKYLALAATGAANISFLFVLRVYLRNFTSFDAIFWLNRNIAASIGFYFIIVVFHFTKNLFGKPHEHVLLNAIIGLSIIITIVLGMYVFIRLGLALQKLQNDFIGLLKELGVVFCYVEVPLTIVGVVLGFNKHLRDSDLFSIAYNTIAIIPNIILIVIFFRAQKYRNENFV